MPRYLLVNAILITAIIAGVWSKLDSHFDKHSNDEEARKGQDVIGDRKHTGLDADGPAKTYRSLLKVKHREQLTAVQNIMNMDNKKKQKALLNELLSKMEKVVKTAKLTIEKAGYKPSDPFPEKDTKLRDAVANIVENTAFFCEFVLRFPSAIEKLLRSGDEWNTLVKWGYEFSSATNLYEEAEKKLLNLAAQQLNLIPRDENFRNPYDKKIQKEEIEREAVRKMEESKKKRKSEKEQEKKKKKERKPSLSKSEL